jgi:glyoxylase-like metal-dependent hydrolase (beta-lactamase superfamily II)
MMKMAKSTSFLLSALFLAAGTGAHEHENPYADVTIQTTEVASGIYMMTGSGGNIAVSIGPDGTFLIDDQFAPLNKKIMKAIKAAGGDTPKFLVNTHWHGDHTGGNQAMGEAGTIIVAHENVRKRLSSDQFVKAFNMKSGPQPKAALPVITFTNEVTFHWNNDDLNMVHVDNAHTDSDSYIFFKNANVIHVGDLYFSGFYPFIDPDSNGSIAGVIAGVNKVLERINDNTKVIPGHGPLSNKTELVAYRDMLSTVYERIKQMKDAGKSQDEVVAAKPTADFDAEWGDGFLQPDQWVGIVYQGV